MDEYRSAWRTENWLRVGGEVFMVQQRWALLVDSYRTGRGNQKRRKKHYTPFPTDEWRIVNLEDQVLPGDFKKLVNAAEEADE